MILGFVCRSCPYATAGELDCIRYCDFGKKLFVEEKITKVVENKSLTLQVTKHNLPFINEMTATYGKSSSRFRLLISISFYRQGMFPKVREFFEELSIGHEDVCGAVGLWSSNELTIPPVK